jgi:hypothetical protein
MRPPCADMRTWCWAGEHWLGSALRKKARKKGFSTGGIQSTLRIFRGDFSGRRASMLAIKPGQAGGVGRGLLSWVPAIRVGMRRLRRMRRSPGDDSGRPRIVVRYVRPVSDRERDKER